MSSVVIAKVEDIKSEALSATDFFVGILVRRTRELSSGAKPRLLYLFRVCTIAPSAEARWRLNLPSSSTPNGLDCELVRRLQHSKCGGSKGANA